MTLEAFPSDTYAVRQCSQALMAIARGCGWTVLERCLTSKRGSEYLVFARHTKRLYVRVSEHFSKWHRRGQDRHDIRPWSTRRIRAVVNRLRMCWRPAPGELAMIDPAQRRGGCPCGEQPPEDSGSPAEKICSQMKNFFTPSVRVSLGLPRQMRMPLGEL